MAAAASSSRASQALVTRGHHSPYVFEHSPVFDFGKLEEKNELKRIALREHRPRVDCGESDTSRRRLSFIWELDIENSRSCPLYSDFGVKNFIVCKFARSMSSSDVQDVLEREFRVQVNGESYRYRFFGHSASQLREKECVLYNTSLGKREKIQAQFGDFQAIRQAHKRAARIGLLLSSAESKVWLTDSEIVQVDDVERNGHCFTDGCGGMSVETANALTEALNIRHLYDHQKVKVPSVFQVRLKGCKGVLALSLEIKNGIQIRPSMVKFKWRQEKTYPLRVVENGYSKPNDIGKINKQFIQLLSSVGVPDNVFERKQLEHMRNVEQLLINQDVAMLYLSAFGQSGLAEKMLTCGITGEVQQYLKKMKREIKQGKTVATPDQKPRSKAEKLQIPIEQSRLVFGICDNTGSLQYDQCFFQPTIRGHPQVMVETKVIVGRSPSHHPGDLRVLSCVDVPNCRHLVDCIVFPINGERPHADEMSGGDLDGDKFFVCWDKELIPSKTVPPCSYTFLQKSHRGSIRGYDPMVTLFAQYNQGSLGHVDRLFNEWANAKGASSAECKCLSELSSKAVDAAKTGSKVNIPRTLCNPPTVSVSKFIWQKMEDKAKLFVEDQLINDLGCTELNHVSKKSMMEIISNLTGTMSDYWLFRLAWKWWTTTSATEDDFVYLTTSIDFSNMTLQQRQLVMVDVTSVGASTPLIPQSVVFNALYRSAVFSTEDLVHFGLDKHGSGWRRLRSLSAHTLTPRVMASILQFPQPKLLILEFILAGLPWGLGLFFSGSFSFDTQETVLELKNSEECHIVALLSIHTDDPIREVRPIPSSYCLLWENGIFQLYEKTKHNTFVFMDVGQEQPLASVALQRFKSSLKDRAPAKLRQEFSAQIEVYVWTQTRDQLPSLLCQVEDENKETVELDTVTNTVDTIAQEFTILEDEFPKLGEEAYIKQKESDMDKEIQQANQLLSAGQLTVQQLTKLVSMINMNAITKDDGTVLACHVEHFLCKGELSLTSSQEYLTVLLSLLHCSGLNGYHQNEPLFRIDKWANGSRTHRLLLGMQQSNVTFTLNELHYLLEYILYACNITVAYYVLNLLHGGDIPLFCESSSPVSLNYYTKWVALLTIEMVEEIANSRAQSKSARVTLFDDSDGRYIVHIQTPKFVVNNGDALLLTPLSGFATEYYVMQVTEPGDRMVTVKQLWPSHNEATTSAAGEWTARCQAGTITYNRELEALGAVFSYNLKTRIPSPVFSSVLYPTSPFVEAGTEDKSPSIPVNEAAIEQPSDTHLPDITKMKIEEPDCASTVQMQKFKFDIFTSKNPVPVTLIQGPPGTGKTQTSACIVSHWYSNSKEPILLTAETNEGVDNLIEKVVQLGTIDKEHILRLGRDEKIKDRSYEYSFESKYEKRCRQKKGFDTDLAKKIIDGVCVVCTTCIGAGVSLLKDRRFTRVLIDEACQATEPAALVPMMYGCTELVLVGDDKQLPPLVKSERAGDLGVSLFKRLSNSGVPVYLLDTQYRMHPDIAKYPSQHFYAGHLKNGVTESERKIPRGFVWPRHGSPLAFVHIKGNEMSIGSSKTNEEEAAEVCKIVQSLLEADDVQPAEIGIITPYKAQETCINNGLSRIAQCSSVFVKTVDGFQGQERDVIIFSAVRSNDHGNIGFLEDKSRFNVALTRARRGLIVVGNSETLSNHRQDDSNEWGKWINWMKEKGFWTNETYTQMTSQSGHFSTQHSGRPYRNEFSRGHPVSSEQSRSREGRSGSSSSYRGSRGRSGRRSWGSGK